MVIPATIDDTMLFSVVLTPVPFVPRAPRRSLFFPCFMPWDDLLLGPAPPFATSLPLVVVVRSLQLPRGSTMVFPCMLLRATRAAFFFFPLFFLLIFFSYYSFFLPSTIFRALRVIVVYRLVVSLHTLFFLQPSQRDHPFTAFPMLLVHTFPTSIHRITITLPRHPFMLHDHTFLPRSSHESITHKIEFPSFASIPLFPSFRPLLSLLCPSLFS
jgi:hypothetical protein